MRKLILDATRPLCDEYDYHGVTREKVVKAAKVSMPTLFNHFPSKRLLVVAAYEPEFLPFIERAKKAACSGEDARKALVSFVHELSVVLTDHPTLCRALLPIGTEPNPADQYTPTFYELQEVFGLLIKAHWKSDHRFGSSASDAAGHHLMTLLGSIAPPNQPRPAEEISTFTLASIL